MPASRTSRATTTTRIYIAQGNTGLVSMRFDGTDRKTHIRVTGNPDYRQATPQPSAAGEILISPDGDRALAEVDNNVFVVDIPIVGGQTPAVLGRESGAGGDSREAPDAHRR